MPECKSCGRAILWGKKADGKAHPVEAVNPSTGNVRFNPDGTLVFGAKGSGHYVSHFATCPEADRWRNGKRA